MNVVIARNGSRNFANTVLYGERYAKTTERNLRNRARSSTARTYVFFSFCAPEKRNHLSQKRKSRIWSSFHSDVAEPLYLVAENRRVTRNPKGKIYTEFSKIINNKNQYTSSNLNY